MGRPIKKSVLTGIAATMKVGTNAVSTSGIILKQEGYNIYRVQDGAGNIGRVKLQQPILYPNGNVSGYNANSISFACTTAVPNAAPVYPRKLTGTLVEDFYGNRYKWSVTAAANALVGPGQYSTVLLPTYTNNANAVPSNLTLAVTQPASTNVKLGGEPVTVEGTITPASGEKILVAFGKAANVAPAYTYFVTAKRELSDTAWNAQVPAPNSNVGGNYYVWVMTGANNNVNVSTFTYNFS